MTTTHPRPPRANPALLARTQDAPVLDESTLTEIADDARTHARMARDNAWRERNGLEPLTRADYERKVRLQGRFGK